MDWGCHQALPQEAKARAGINSNKSWCEFYTAPAPIADMRTPCMHGGSYNVKIA